jgi:hypothetical protein
MERFAEELLMAKYQELADAYSTFGGEIKYFKVWKILPILNRRLIMSPKVAGGRKWILRQNLKVTPNPFASL